MTGGDDPRLCPMFVRSVARASVGDPYAQPAVGR